MLVVVSECTLCCSRTHCHGLAGTSFELIRNAGRHLPLLRPTCLVRCPCCDSLNSRALQPTLGHAASQALGLLEACCFRPPAGSLLVAHPFFVSCSANIMLCFAPPAIPPRQVAEPQPRPQPLPQPEQALQPRQRRRQGRLGAVRLTPGDKAFTMVFTSSLSLCSASATQPVERQWRGRLTASST